MYGGGGNSGREEEKKRQARVESGMRQIDANFSQFDDDFYTKRAQAYTDVVTPQLTEQFNKTKKNLSYQLARSGLSTSGTAIDESGSLNRELENKQRQVADAALAQGNSTRSDVENQRTQLVNQLNASGDPAQISAGLTASTANLRAPSPVGPVGNFFSDWTNIYMANQNARAQNPEVNPMFSFGGNNNPSSTVTR